MAVLPVLCWPDARLSAPCAAVGAITPALCTLARDMLETMYDASGRGLAAPQVGAMLRLFVMDLTWKEGAPSPQVMFNPEILWQSGQQAAGPEGCLSIPGIVTEITRATSLRLAWIGVDGEARIAVLDGMAAICAQHEIDHLDGLVTFDRLAPPARDAAMAEYARLSDQTPG